jgi:membrane-associated protein
MLLSPHSHHLVAALNPLSSTSLLASLGALGVFLVLFAETGLLIGFFLPGDSLLFTAGLLCTASASHAVHLSLPLVILAAIGGALLGAQTGFLIGRAGGRPLLQRSHHRFLRNGAERADQLLERYGYRKAIVLGRFIPVVRTVLNPMAGALAVPARTFTVWQVIGGVAWSAGVTLAGYGLGSTIPSIDTYLLPIIAVIVVVSLIPIGLELFRTRSAGRGEAGAGSGAEGRGAELSGPDHRGRTDRADLTGRTDPTGHPDRADRAGEAARNVRP